MGADFNPKKFFVDVFDSRHDEVVLFLVDLSHPTCPDNDDWKERREMAKEWYEAMCRLASDRHFDVFPICYYPATGVHSGALPYEIVDLIKERRVTLILAMTTWSATGPLGEITKQVPNLRVASMPGILQRMEQSALAADYAEVQRRCRQLKELMQKAAFCDVGFVGGHDWTCRFDLRHRTPHMDDGYLGPDKKFGEGDSKVINLPSGETYIAPYEGEIKDDESLTNGRLPIVDPKHGEGTVIFEVKKNKIVEVVGDNPCAEFYRKFFDEDEARRNIAECAFGVNPCAVVTGNVLEDEKAGFHWAYGLSSHLGGTWGPDRFKFPETRVHQDFVYAKGNPIQVEFAGLLDADGNYIYDPIIQAGEYKIFGQKQELIGDPTHI